MFGGKEHFRDSIETQIGMIYESMKSQRDDFNTSIKYLKEDLKKLGLSVENLKKENDKQLLEIAYLKATPIKVLRHSQEVYIELPEGITAYWINLSNDKADLYTSINSYTSVYNTVIKTSNVDDMLAYLKSMKAKTLN